MIREVVLEHPSVDRIEVAYSKVGTLRLVMPRLVEVELVESCVWSMQVTSNVVLTLETDMYCGKLNRVIPGGEMVTFHLFE